MIVKKLAFIIRSEKEMYLLNNSSGKERVRLGVGAKSVFAAAPFEVSCFLHPCVCSPWLGPFVDETTSQKWSRLKVLCVWIWVFASAHLLNCDVLWLLLKFWLLWAFRTPSLQRFLSKRFLLWTINVGGLGCGGSKLLLCDAEEWEGGMTLQKRRVTSNHKNQAVKNDESLLCHPYIWQFCVTYELNIWEVYMYFFFPLTVTKSEADKLLDNFQSSANTGASFGSSSLECLSQKKRQNRH